MIRFLPLGLILVATALGSTPSPLPSPTDTQLAALGVADFRRAATADAPASQWQTAHMVGNGETGALVMGRPNDETIIISRAGLFLPLTPPRDPPAQGEHLPEIRRMIAAGEYQKAADFVYDLSLKEGYTGTHWVDPFVPVCSLRITSTASADAGDYLRSIDYPTGVAGVRWTDRGDVVVQKVFASRADDVIVYSLRRDKGTINARLAFVQHDPRVAPEKDRPNPDAFSQVETSASGAQLTFRSRFASPWPGSAQGAFATAHVVAQGGQVEAQEDAVQVSDASEVLVVIKVSAIDKWDSFNPAPLVSATTSVTSEYAALLQRHVEKHGSLFNRSRISLGGSDADHRLTSKQLFAKSFIGQPLPALLEKQYDASRYLILSATGTRFPPTLQGIWSGTWSPPWSSAFTHDGNVPVAVIGNLPANLPELMEGYFSYHERQIDDYRRNAQRLFGARGIVLPAHSTSHGLHNHFGPRWCLTFWSGGAAWAAHYFYDYFRYTGDTEFLRNRALPFMKEVALFYEDFLAGSEDAIGFVTFSPSYSPENDPANTGSQATINATMDMAVTRELLQNLIAGCERLGVDEESIPRWRALLAKLPPYRINKDGALAEWISPLLEDNYGHRHVSHFYELYDSLPDHIGNDPQLMKAFEVAVQKRTAWRRQIGGGEMAFGQAQMGAVAASLRLSDIAFENLDMLANWFWFPESMMTAHNPQELFNTDIAGGIPQLMIRMLLDSQPGWMELLPALPSQWPSGKIEGVLCRGQVEVESLEWSPSEVRLVVVSPFDQTIELRSAAGKVREKLTLKAGQPKEVRQQRTAPKT